MPIPLPRIGHRISPCSPPLRGIPPRLSPPVLFRVRPGRRAPGSLQGQAFLHLDDRLFVVRAGFFDDLRAWSPRSRCRPGRPSLSSSRITNLSLSAASCGSVVKRIERSVLTLFEHRVAEADVDGREGLELQPVQFFQPGQAVDSLAALGRAVERQFFGDAFQVGDRFEVVFFRGRDGGSNRVCARERGRRERRQVFFFEFGFRLFVGFGARRPALLRVPCRRTRSARSRRTPGSRRSTPL